MVEIEFGRSDVLASLLGGCSTSKTGPFTTAGLTCLKGEGNGSRTTISARNRMQRLVTVTINIL